MRAWRIPVFGIVMLLTASGPVLAATINAASCSVADIQTAHTAAANGDTIAIPAGTCAWSTALTITKAVTLLGAGTLATTGASGNVVLTHDGTTTLVNVTEAAAGVIRFANLRWSQTGGGTSDRFVIFVTAAASGRPVLVDHNDFLFNTAGSVTSALKFATNRGVVSKNKFTNAEPVAALYINSNSTLRCKPAPNLTDLPLWQVASTMGTADTTGENNVYYEDNVVTEFTTETLDPDDACRIVIRYNTFNNSGIASHGNDTSLVGVRHWELYNNTFVFANLSGPGFPPNLNWWFNIRGGTGVVTDNIMPDISSVQWGNKTEITIYVENLRRNAGNGCWLGSYPSDRQFGFGHNGTAQISEPAYFWNNLVAVAGAATPNPAAGDFSPDTCGGGPTVTDYVQLGRDYALTAKPGYTEYTYPHPLTVSTPSVVPAVGRLGTRFPRP